MTTAELDKEVVAGADDGTGTLDLAGEVVGTGQGEKPLLSLGEFQHLFENHDYRADFENRATPPFFYADYWGGVAQSGNTTGELTVTLWGIEQSLMKDYYEHLGLPRLVPCPWALGTSTSEFYLIGAEPPGLRYAFEKGLLDQTPGGNPIDATYDLGREEGDAARRKIYQKYRTPTDEELESSRGVLGIALCTPYLHGLDQRQYFDRMVLRLEEREIRTSEQDASEAAINSADELIRLVERGAIVDQDFVYLTERQVHLYASPERPEGEATFVHEDRRGIKNGMSAARADIDAASIRIHKGAARKIGFFLSDKVIEELQTRLRDEPDLLSEAEQAFETELVKMESSLVTKARGLRRKMESNFAGRMTLAIGGFAFGLILGKAGDRLGDAVASVANAWSDSDTKSA